MSIADANTLVVEKKNDLIRGKASNTEGLTTVDINHSRFFKVWHWPFLFYDHLPFRDSLLSPSSSGHTITHFWHPLAWHAAGGNVDHLKSEHQSPGDNDIVTDAEMHDVVAPASCRYIIDVDAVFFGASSTDKSAVDAPMVVPKTMAVAILGATPAAALPAKKWYYNPSPIPTCCLRCHKISLYIPGANKHASTHNCCKYPSPPQVVRHWHPPLSCEMERNWWAASNACRELSGCFFFLVWILFWYLDRCHASFLSFG